MYPQGKLGWTHCLAGTGLNLDRKMTQLIENGKPLCEGRKGCLSHGAEVHEVQRAKAPTSPGGLWRVHPAGRNCMWCYNGRRPTGAKSWSLQTKSWCLRRMQEGMQERGLETRREGQQSWKNTLTPTCEGSCSLRHPTGREVPWRVSKHRCDTIKDVFPIHHPFFRWMSLRKLATLKVRRPESGLKTNNEIRTEIIGGKKYPGAMLRWQINRLDSGSDLRAGGRELYKWWQHWPPPWSAQWLGTS